MTPKDIRLWQAVALISLGAAVKVESLWAEAWFSLVVVAFWWRPWAADREE
jgi:hypothetical protein